VQTSAQLMPLTPDIRLHRLLSVSG